MHTVCRGGRGALFFVTPSWPRAVAPITRQDTQRTSLEIDVREYARLHAFAAWNM